MNQGWCFDIEADNLYLLSKKVWYIRLKANDGSRTLSVYPFREGVDSSASKIKEWVHSFDDGCTVLGWNHLGYDLWMLWKHFGIMPRVGKSGKDWLDGKPVQFIDGFVLSMYLNPNSPKHSLEYVTGGEQADKQKIDYRQTLIDAGALAYDTKKGEEFSFFHELMVPYCDRDVDSTISAIKKLWLKAEGMYKNKWLHPSFRQMQKDYWLYSAQAYTGVKFDVEKATALVEHITEKMLNIKQEVDPQLPSRALKTAEKAFYKQPAKPYQKSGELSVAMQKWLQKHDAKLVDGKIHAYGLVVDLEANAVLPVELPMEIEDGAELKQYFLDSGWVPSDEYWNFKKGDDGKPIRDERGKLIKTTPKINQAGQLCPNLEKLQGNVPSKVVKFLSYRNRLGILSGWLNNWRIAFDGRLSSEISGYAPTSRVKHKTVVNVPKADPKVLLGNEMRELFTVEEGNFYVGADAAALENRTLSHYTYKYDNGAFAKLQTEGDPHSFNAFAFFPHLHKDFDIDNPENKENPVFKTWRNKAKTGAYLLAFGGGAPKLASSLGLSKEEGRKAFDNYWEKNKGLGLLKESVEKYFETEGQGKYIPAIDGRLVSVRGKNVLLSCLGQGLGAIAMSYAACLIDTWFGDLYLDDIGRPYYLVNGFKVRRLSQVHDEHSWECEDGIQDYVVKVAVDAIVKAGEVLKLSLPLDGEGKIGKTWKDVH